GVDDAGGAGPDRRGTRNDRPPAVPTPPATRRGGAQRPAPRALDGDERRFRGGRRGGRHARPRRIGAVRGAWVKTPRGRRAFVLSFTVEAALPSPHRCPHEADAPRPPQAAVQES